jgi:aminoglycoside/choline kinase family phosphotransferase
MSKKTRLPETLLKFIARRPGASWKRIRSEASRRCFYRLRWGRKTLVAMVYPEPAQVEVERFCAMQKIYRDHGLRVPRIDQVLGDQVLIQEDAGDLLLQRAWQSGSPELRRRWLDQCREILGRLAAVQPGLTAARLDQGRLQWEMDFFIANFFPRFRIHSLNEANLGDQLRLLVGSLPPGNTFAHRDFHSRNLLVFGKEIVMVDFQDTLVAPRYYDMVSLAFDSYLDLGHARKILLSDREWPANESRQLRLTALQRNIKALGTFAYQVHERKNATYGKYIPRTLRHIQSHLKELDDPELHILSRYFSSVTRNA